LLGCGFMKRQLTWALCLSASAFWVAGCGAEARPAESAGSAAMQNQPSGSSQQAGGASPAAGSGAQKECRGPGRYEAGKEGSYRPCCEGLHEVPYKKSAWSGDFGEVRVCAQFPLNVYACVKGTCGDGLCEEGEAPACGCVEDCPQAAWEDPPRDDPADKSGLSGTPASCKKDDLLARLQGGDALGIDCGDLALNASSAEKSQAAQCARDAFVNQKSFSVFWRTQGTDSIVHQGVYGTHAGMGMGGLITYSVYVDADTFGIDVPGATAAWSACSLALGTTCTGTIDDCLACTPASGYPVCGCLPAGPRPGSSDGKAVEIKCEPR
jgi:hypothetical protein